MPRHEVSGFFELASVLLNRFHVKELIRLGLFPTVNQH